MNPMSGEFSIVVNALGWTIVHSVWQCGIVAALLQGFLKYDRSWSPNARSLLCIACLLLCAALSVTTFSSYYQTALTVRLDFESSTVASSVAADSFGFRVSFNRLLPYIVILWSLGCSISLTSNALRLRHCYTLRVKDTVVAPAEWQNKFAFLSEKAGVTRPAALRISRRVDMPCVIGHVKPVVLLPVAVLANFSRDQIELVLLHELGHIRRNDYVAGLVQAFLKTIYFFNPGVLAICRLLDSEREKACDDIAMSVRHSPLNYAKALQEFANMKSDNNLAMSAAGNRHQLLVRIKRLFDAQPHAPRPLEPVFAAVGVLLLGFVLASYANAQSDHHKVTETNPVAVLHATDIEPEETILPLEKVAPRYPLLAVEDKVEGYCTVEFTVSEKGRTEKARILECSPDGYFEESALAAVSDFRYEPKIVDGVPVAIAGVRNKFTYTLPNASR